MNDELLKNGGIAKNCAFVMHALVSLFLYFKMALQISRSVMASQLINSLGYRLTIKTKTFVLTTAFSTFVTVKEPVVARNHSPNCLITVKMQ